MPVLELNNIVKGFRAPDGATTPILSIARFSLEEGEQMALVGESGSGKTTLLNVIAGILRPDSGTVRCNGQEISGMPEPTRDRFRANHIGYIFQSFNLLPGYTALENVLLGMAFGPGADKSVATEMLGRVGLKDRLHYLPRQLSSGQQQRVALARALANRPKVVLADEPTGNLDHRNAEEALLLLRSLCTEKKAALLLVSHDREVISKFDRQVQFATLNEVLQP